MQTVYYGTRGKCTVYIIATKFYNHSFNGSRIEITEQMGQIHIRSCVRTCITLLLRALAGEFSKVHNARENIYLADWTLCIN